MDNRIVAIEEYWPPVVKNLAEFQQIAVAENPEFNKLYECVRRILQESYVKDASNYGVERWERILGIVPNPTDTLDARKTRILTYLNLKLPYTWRVLENMILAFMGENNFTMKYINDSSLLEVLIRTKDASQHETILTLLQHVVPLNVVIKLGYLE